ncbi:MAG TPA: molybdopterin-binding protein [Candidatus Limnocylindrales bacterium]|jgi:nicotinamide-nucleotide amidase
MADANALQSPVARPIVTAELLAVGTELTVGETTDTNSGELARSLVAMGVTVLRVSDLPDDLGVVVDALRTALGRADLVVTTGGLGPTPDDLTREAVAEACGETPVEDEATLAWLRELWARRRQPFPEVNRKQAWTIPSAAILANPNGTAPGWLIQRPDGRVIVTLPGPPREMRPMWTDEALPRLAARGVGLETEVRTLRLTGIGESQVAERLGEPLLRATNPIVATYARQEAVDIRISARSEGDRGASALADVAEAAVVAALGEFVWARGDMTWAGAIAEALDRRGWTLASTESGTGGAFVGLLRGSGRLLRAEVLGGTAAEIAGGGTADKDEAGDLATADAARTAAGADVGIAVRAAATGNDTAVNVAVATPTGGHAERRLAFMRGGLGAERAAIASATVLLNVLRADEGPSA